MAKERMPNGPREFLRQYPDGVAPDGVLILCGRCKVEQPPTGFYIPAWIRALADGRRTTPYCRDCMHKASVTRKAPRTEVIHAAKAEGCVDCGLVDLEHPEIFDFDHVRGVKLANIAILNLSGTIERLKDEIAKCEVVCANCHRIRTKARGPVTRGRDGRKSSRAIGSKHPIPAR